MPSPLRLAAAAALLAAPTVLAFFSGRLLRRDPRPGGRARDRARLAPRGPVILSRAAPAARRPAQVVVALAGLTAFVAWSALSLLWSPLRDPGLADVERSALYLAAFLLGCCRAARRGHGAGGRARAARRHRDRVRCYALATRLLPGIVDSTSGFRAGSRLDQPLTYWNALGALASMGLMLAIAHRRPTPRRAERLRIAGDGARAGARPRALPDRLARRPPGSRASGRSCSCWPRATAGRVDSTLLGFALVALMAGRRRRASRAWWSCTAAWARASARASRCSACSLVVSALAALGQACSCGSRRAGRPGRRALRRRPALVAGVAAAALAAWPSAWPRSRAARSALAATRKGPERFRTLETNRWHYWRVALDSSPSEPLTGSGMHGFAADWLERRDIDEGVQDAHSLYIETLTELGLPGLLFLLAVPGRRGRRALARRRARLGRRRQRSGRFTPGSTGTGRCPP